MTASARLNVEVDGKVVGRGTSVVFGVLKRVTGVDLLNDLSVFFRSLGGVIDGFRERSKGVKDLLADPATTFLVVTSPEREPVEEAIFFRNKLIVFRQPDQHEPIEISTPAPSTRR